MKIILLDDVATLGRRGEVRDVSDGYARNCLLPQKLALNATAANLKNLDTIKARHEGQAATLRAVATDGHRLAQVELPLPAGAQGMPGVIIPRKTVLELRKLLEEAADAIKITLSETKISFFKFRRQWKPQARRRLWRLNHY